MPKLNEMAPAILLCLSVAGCVQAPAPQVSKAMPSEEVLAPVALAGFESAEPQQRSAQRSNGSIAQDFLRLTFAMESGRSLPILTRFEGPITVRLTGAVPATAPADMERLISRLQGEAGLNIRQVGAAGPASVTVEFLPRRELASAVRSAACFVVPEVASFDDYRRNGGFSHVSWSSLTTRRQVAIFAPSDSTPQEVRDCLHEELAQAIGPVNDLYHLTDSVFNDDNFNSSLTAFDMLVLRAYYAPELGSGMNEAEVALRLPALLARLNPAGESAGPGLMAMGTNRNWSAAVEASFGADGSPASRVAAAERMLSIAMAQGWTDGRLAFSHYAMGRALLSRDSARAVEHLNRAADLYARAPGGDQHRAHVDLQLAALALSSGQDRQAVALADRALPIARTGQNAALVASLMMIKAEALSELGQSAQAEAVLLDSQDWAMYGFGSQARIRAHHAEIARLARRG